MRLVVLISGDIAHPLVDKNGGLYVLAAEDVVDVEVADSTAPGSLLIDGSTEPATEVLVLPSSKFILLGAQINLLHGGVEVVCFVVAAVHAQHYGILGFSILATAGRLKQPSECLQ